MTSCGLVKLTHFWKMGLEVFSCVSDMFSIDFVLATNRRTAQLSRKKVVITGDMANRERVLVTGVTGFVGSHIAEHLAEHDFEVVGLIRRTSSLKFIQHLDIDLRVADLADREGLREVVGDIDYVVHPAGLIKAKSLEEFMAVNRGGTEYILDSVAKFRPELKRFVYISSQAAAGPSEEGKPTTEDMPERPVSDYGRSKLAGEEVCAEYADNLPITILRPPAVFGPRDAGTFPFFKMAKSGWYWKLGRDEGYASVVYVKDLAESVRMVVESDADTSGTFFIANSEAPSIWELQKLIGSLMKVEVRPLYTPLWIAHVMAYLDAFAAFMLSRERNLSRDKLAELKERYWICDPSKAESVFGWKAQTPLEKALKETIDWYIENRWL